MKDAEMMEEEMKVSGIREKMREFDFMAYFYQSFSRTESPRWHNPKYSDQFNHFCYWVHVESCPEYSRMRLSYMKQQMCIHIWQSYLGTVAIGGLQLSMMRNLPWLSDVLPLMNVATQLADLLAWLHKKKIAVGSITASCIMIDKEVDIKVFDFGYICNRVNGFCWCWTMKSDVYIFGLLLVELITKTKLRSNPSVFDICKPGSFVHKCFEDVDDQTVFDITLLACRCVIADPGERPTMKMVLNDLDKLRKRVGKRKRDENESTIE